jgi:hypothetical protein
MSPCSKITYEHRAEAARALRIIAKHKGLNGKPEVYRCSHCGGWHWGSSNRPRSTSKQRFNRARRGSAERW